MLKVFFLKPLQDQTVASCACWLLWKMHHIMDNFTVSAVLASLLLGLLAAVFFRKPKHLKSLRHKHVFITGGSRGIGFSLAKACLSEGAFVTIISRTHSKLVSARDSLTKELGYPADHIFLKAVDVTDAAAVSSVIKESFDWRPIDVLICNAAIVLGGEFDQVKIEDLEIVARTNILGCVHPIHAALPLMKSRSQTNASAIVIIGSVSSLAYLKDFNIYLSTKFALKGLAEYLRIELMPYHIPVCLVCPGYTETAMLDEVDKVCETSNLVSKLCFYKRDEAQSADDVAIKTIEGAKRGDPLITTNLMGFFAGVLGRGFIPSDSFPRAVMELVLLVPVRIVSFVIFLHMKRVLQKHAQTNSKDREEVEAAPYVHSIDDSAADDDAHLDLWSH